MLCIESVENGWTVARVGEDESLFAFEGGDTDQEDLEAVQRMLYHITERLGMYGTKHDPHRIRIVVVDQRENEDPSAL